MQIYRVGYRNTGAPQYTRYVEYLAFKYGEAFKVSVELSCGSIKVEKLENLDGILVMENEIAEAIERSR